LPEDPIAGKASEAQWREHLAEEDEERLLANDRRALKLHQKIVALLTRARGAYEQAHGKNAVLRVQADMPDTEAHCRKLMGEINQWGNVSPLTATYETLLTSLKEDLPQARLAALNDGKRSLEAVEQDWAARLRRIKHRLHEAAEGEGR